MRKVHTSSITVDKNSPLAIHLKVWQEFSDKISQINTAAGVATGWKKSDVGNRIGIIFKNINCRKHNIVNIERFTPKKYSRHSSSTNRIFLYVRFVFGKNIVFFLQCYCHKISNIVADHLSEIEEDRTEPINEIPRILFLGNGITLFDAIRYSNTD